MKRILIMGCGRQGARLAELLEAEQYEVSVIDQSSAAFHRLHSFRGLRVVGNGIDEEVLRRAGIEGAWAFAAATNGDNTNLMAAQIARVIFEVPQVVCRVYDPERASLYYDLGMKTVSATTVGARMLRNLLIAPKVLRQYQLGDGGAVALEFKLGPSTEGKTLADLEIAGEFRISGVLRDQAPFVPDSGYVAQSNDQIFGVAMARSMTRLQDHLNIQEFAFNMPSRGGN